MSSSSFARRRCSGLSPLNPLSNALPLVNESLVISFPVKRFRHLFSTSRSSNMRFPISSSRICSRSVKGIVRSGNLLSYYVRERRPTRCEEVRKNHLVADWVTPHRQSIPAATCFKGTFSGILSNQLDRPARFPRIPLIDRLETDRHSQKLVRLTAHPWRSGNSSRRSV
jgi:hypothetical protein